MRRKTLNYHRRIKPQSNFKYSYYRVNRDIKDIANKRYNILTVLIVMIMGLLFTRLFYLQVIKSEYYLSKVRAQVDKLIEGSTAPRGRIYDRNHRLIVDNVPTKVIYYQKNSKNTTKKELELAYKVADIIDVDFSKLSNTSLKEFWILNNSSKARNKITKEEWKKLSQRKLDADDIKKLQLKRITSDDLKKYNDHDKEAAYIYYLMNKGYSKSEKIIKRENITDEEYAEISENSHNLVGFNTRLDWDRTYPYGDTFKAILGSVSTTENGIPYELKDYYTSKGYSLNDRVGTSYLEYQYEDILRGTKNKYKTNSDGSNTLVEKGTRGNDIVLTIDIELQKAVEEIIDQEMRKAKDEPNTEYYNRSFVIISDPKTGAILTMAGRQIVKQDGGYKIYDYTPGITTSPVVVGSVVKGASNIVGYNTGALTIGERRNDSCIKIAATPPKCSWKYLGNLDDITALKLSSNTYQFRTALKVAKANYVYNKPLVIDKSAFMTYRNTFAEFGLGVKTGIDLPVESLGYKGGSEVAGHLLDFAIGQYDTYTPIQLSQYIGTIASSGYRMQPHLLNSVYSSNSNDLTNLYSEVKPKVLNKLNTKDEYLDRVKKGFEKVLDYGGTGIGYIDLKYKPAGKTGTSESFVDTNNDGKIDTETVTNTFVAYAPSDNPTVTFTVISPDIYNYKSGTTYQTSVNRRIAKAVSEKYFELYNK